METLHMAVEAPSHNSAPMTIASRAPRVASDSDEDMRLARKVNGNDNGNGKRAGSSSSSGAERPLVS